MSKVGDVILKTVPGLIGMIVDAVRRRRERKAGRRQPIPRVRDRRDQINEMWERHDRERE
jgi:hypothetical protein